MYRLNSPYQEEGMSWKLISSRAEWNWRDGSRGVGNKSSVEDLPENIFILYSTIQQYEGGGCLSLCLVLYSGLRGTVDMCSVICGIRQICQKVH